MEAQTGHEKYADQSPDGAKNPELAIKLTSGESYFGEITGEKDLQSNVSRIIESGSMHPSLTHCLTRADIAQVSLHAPYEASDGWLVTSITTFMAAGSEDSPLQALTSDLSLNKWVDYNEQHAYPYNARIVPLRLADCVVSIVISATTGDLDHAEFYRIHKLVLKLKDKEVRGDIEGPAPRGENYSTIINMTDFKTGFTPGCCSGCVRVPDIMEVRIEAGHNNGWFISSITTSVVDEENTQHKLTSDPQFEKWVDGNERYPYDATKHILTLG